MHKVLDKLIIYILIVILLVSLVLVGPMNYFVHGFYAETVDISKVEEHILGHVDLSEVYSVDFTPKEDLFCGFEIILDQPIDNAGTLLLTIADQEGNLLDEMSEDLEKIDSMRWYKILSEADLHAGESYRLTIVAEDCDSVPALALVDVGYKCEEISKDNLLIRCAYKKVTFSEEERFLMVLFLLVLIAGLSAHLAKQDKVKRTTYKICLMGILFILMSWNFMFGTLDPDNRDFGEFQYDSESLVIGPILGQEKDIYNPSVYGLGRYSDISGTYGLEVLLPSDDDLWDEGYHKKEAGTIAVLISAYINNVAKVGNYIQFANGEKLEITQVYTGDYKEITLNTNEILTKGRYGDLSQAVFYEKDQWQWKPGDLSVYTSQLGLQGLAFRYLSGIFSVENMRLLCSMLTAAVLLGICYLLCIKYDMLVGGIWYITFLLSPWITNFARNLYWVEFTWFIPMAIGLLCSIYIENRTVRILSYFGTFISIAGKCLCGYEYISTIMMGLILFLLVDFVEAWGRKDRKKQGLLIRTIFIVGISAIAGFFLALCMHAYLRGAGDVVQGLKTVFTEDVLRRTSVVSGSLNTYSAFTVESLLVPVSEVLRKYMEFNTRIIVGVDGYLFPLLCLIPLAIWVSEYRNGKSSRWIAMYILSFLTTASWYILAKGHSYCHIHMNYVLWYFGYVQTCLYVIVSKLLAIKQSR